MIKSIQFELRQELVLYVCYHPTHTKKPIRFQWVARHLDNTVHSVSNGEREKKNRRKQKTKNKKHEERDRHFSFIKCRCHFSIIVVILFGIFCWFSMRWCESQHMRIMRSVKWICSISADLNKKYFSCGLFLNRVSLQEHLWICTRITHKRTLSHSLWHFFLVSRRSSNEYLLWPLISSYISALRSMMNW